MTDTPTIDDEQWAPTVASSLRSEDRLASILRDIIKVSEAPAQRGVRVMPPREVGEARLNDLRNGGCTTQPFAVAFRYLAGGRSRTALARRTGIARTHVHRLITGQYPPSMEDMERIAKAFDRRPTYFLEYRVGLISKQVSDYLTANPEASIPLAKQLAD